MVAYLTNAMWWLQWKEERNYVIWQGNNLFLIPAPRLDAQLHRGIDLEVVSRLYDKYNMTCVATKVAWYIPCVRLSRGWASGRIASGCKGWVVGWVCGRGLCEYGFLKDTLLGYLDGKFLGQVNGCGLGKSDIFCWEVLNGPRLGDSERVLVKNSWWTLARWFGRIFG